MMVAMADQPSFRLKTGLAEMLKGGVIMDVVTPEQARVAEDAGAAVPEVVAFERQDDWGGQWNLDWRTGADRHGEPVHSAMYRDLWINGPKECMEYPDYPFDAHFGRAVSSYLPREAMRDYIVGRVAEVAGRIRYPDAFVTCGEPGAPGDTVSRSPVVVFEVLSESTQTVDRTDKAREYRETPSVQRYVMLEQDEIAATMFERVGDDWLGRILAEDAVIRMPEIGIELPLAELYEGLYLPPPASEDD